MAYTPELRRLLEIAGTLEHHEKEEHRLFHHICKQLGELETFCHKQHESDVYGPIAHQAKALSTKLEKHFDRYKNMTPDKEEKMEHGDEEHKEEEKEVHEEWDSSAEVHHTGENTDKSIEELEKELEAARQRGDTTAMRQKAFAIRAKKAHGGKWKGVTA